jgi:hypothetical protein
MVSPMQTGSGQTRFAGWGRRGALAALAATAAAVIACQVVALARAEALSPHRVQGGSTAQHAATPSDAARDLALYRAVVTRVRSGEPYYDVAADELRRRGYSTGSIFNWRLPTYAWLNGTLLGPTGGSALLGALMLAAALLLFESQAREGGMRVAALAVLVAAGFFGWVLVPDVFLVQELWAGTLIVLSVAAYARQRWPLAVAAGLAAMFYRELAVGYCLVAAALAWRDRRRAESAVWVIGFAAFAVALALHGRAVAARAVDDRFGHALDWFAFGGLPFVLKTCRANLLLFAAPGAVLALFLPLSLLGLLGRRGPGATLVTLTAVGYLLAFAVVGQPFNFYWGMLIAPLLAVGVAWSPRALRDLVRQAGGDARDAGVIEGNASAPPVSAHRS